MLLDLPDQLHFGYSSAEFDFPSTSRIGNYLIHPFEFTDFLSTTSDRRVDTKYESKKRKYLSLLSIDLLSTVDYLEVALVKVGRSRDELRNIS